MLVGRRRQPLGCLGLYVCVVIYYCMKTLKNLHKFDGVVKNDGNGGRRRMMRGYPAMRIDYIRIKLVDCMLLLLDINYNLGLVLYIYL